MERKPSQSRQSLYNPPQFIIIEESSCIKTLDTIKEYFRCFQHLQSTNCNPDVAFDVNDVAFSHNGRWIATASADKTVAIWKY